MEKQTDADITNTNSSTPEQQTSEKQTTESPEQQEQQSILDQAGKPKSKETNSEGKGDDKSILDQAGEKEKQKQEAEEKRLLDTPEDQLTDEDKQKKADLLKRKEDDKKGQDKEIPEKYEFKFGEGVKLDETIMQKSSDVFKDLKLDQEEVDKLTGLYQDILKYADTQAENDFKTMNQEFRKETMDALGSDYEKEMSYAAKAKDRFFSKESMDLLNASGLSNQKSFLMDLIKMGKLISEDVTTTTRPATVERSAAEVMFPTQKKK